MISEQLQKNAGISKYYSESPQPEDFNPGPFHLLIYPGGHLDRFYFKFNGPPHKLKL